MVKVSVVLAIYNAEKFLNECLDSLLKQTLKEIEIICVDDGSKDKTPQILKQYSAKDNRVVHLNQDNQGAGAARNNGMRVAKGEYIIFLDCDDMFEHAMLEKMYSACVNDELDVVVCRSDKFDSITQKRTEAVWTIKNKLLPEKKVFASQEIEKDFFMVFVWWAWDKLYKKSFIDKLGLEFQCLRTTNDLYFTVCSMMMAQRISYMNDVLVHQRIGNNSSLSVTREKSWDCFYRALLEVRNYMKENGLYERLEQDFINYCLHFSTWHLETLHGYSYCLLYKALKNGWYDELGIGDKESSYFYDSSLYKKKEHIMSTDVEVHLCNKILCLEKEIENIKSGAHRLYVEEESNFEKVKRYYKNHGFKNTIKKIINKLTS